MPDWSYHPLFKPILRKLPPTFSREFIHRGMSLLASRSVGVCLIEFLGHMTPSNKLEKQVFGVVVPSPVGLSGKIDPHLSGLTAFQNLGFGFIEFGPVSLHGSAHEEELRIDPARELIWQEHAISIRLSTIKQRLHSIKNKKLPFFIRAEGTFEEITRICDELLPYSDGFIINSEVFKSPTQYAHFLQKMNKPVILAYSAGNFNELGNYHPSGILLEGELIDYLSAIRDVAGLDVPIITSGGIREPADGVKLLEDGASLVMLGYEYVFAGPGLPKRINEAYSHRHPEESVPLAGWLSDVPVPSTPWLSDEPVLSAGWLWYWLFGLAITIAGFIALFFSMTAIILPYDESFLEILRGDILAFNPAILCFMAHDRMTLSGTMISGGIIYMQLAKHGVRNGLHWARRAINIAGILGFVGILLFIGYGYFDWLHGLFWLILLPLFIFGYLKSKNAVVAPSSTNLFNHRFWKWSLIGQLSFVVLGCALTVGGGVISVIGATGVFVPTDLTYLCLTPEMLNEFNERLIPVIAHDRAGFGSALLSVGLLVLTLALWGIREGERWVWWTFAVGAIPAFAAGIITHFIIGYTDFVHLLPAYIAFGLYLIGVIFTAPFLFLKNGGRDYDGV